MSEMDDLVVHIGANGWGYPACGVSTGTYVVTDEIVRVTCENCRHDYEITWGPKR